MKKILIGLFGLSVIAGLFFVFTTEQEQESPMILSKLEDKGFADEGREFIFTLENVGKYTSTLEFPTWLEYNINLKNLDGKEMPSGEKILEHLDLNEDKDKGRTLDLNPNQSIEYRVIVNNVPNGNYELTIISASGLGGTKRKKFTIEN